ncbi:carcinoembryonic antigen-related cell adhesion molecule 8-like isoform X2 [Pseudophryne corroboree]|uniref:carcinoembryonic antigen-related cell adhesion molecule 8-like isoform X2 n=1 Tax=Pseudophryne corroboree TaxID=495146 RepID=UPI0030819141
MCSWRQHLSHCAILSGLLSLWMDLTSGMVNIQLIPQYPVIGESVTLGVTGVTGRVASIIWHKGPNTNKEYLILTYLPNDPSPLLPGPLYVSRARPFPDGSLLITDLHITDTDNYIVKVQTEKTQEQASVTLTVYERVSKPKVSASTSQPKENDTFTLTCDTRNAERILWSRNSVSLPSGPILSADNRTVTFSRVTRGDSGDYRCEAENPASRSISDPYTVTISYGPENVQITGKLYVNFGSDISLSCSADSVPPADYQWRFKDGDLNPKQNTLLIHNASSDKQGTYSCVVTNAETRLTVTTSVFVNVTAVGPENVTITGLLHMHVGSDTSLNCSADSLPPPTYRWRFNDRELNESKTLQIYNATLKDQGNYTCVVINPETKRTVNASVYLSVTMEAANNGGMDKGHIIGIVVACLLLVALVAAMLYLFIIHKQRKKPSDKLSMVNIPATNASYTQCATVWLKWTYISLQDVDKAILLGFHFMFY